MQSALLEAMAEKQVTVDNHTRALDQLFFVIATQNPLDLAGTYPLPAPSPPLTHRLPSTSTSVWRGPRLRSDTCVVPSEPVLNLLFTPPPLHGMSCRKSPSVATPLAAISSRL